MIGISANSGKTSYGVVRLVLDTPEDFINIPTHYEAGSTAFVISTSKSYMLNSLGQWKLIGTSGSEGGGGDTPTPGDTIIYDGGVIF